MSTSTMLKVNYLIFGEDPSRIATVQVEKTGSVVALKAAIKDANKNDFRNVDSMTLDLWSTSFTVDDQLKANTEDLVKMSPLFPSRKLVQVFPDQLDDQHIHIVVQPPKCEC
jgi:hypothetical protein